MSDCVLDASAILAIMLGQPAGPQVLPFIPGALVSAVNLAEVVGRMIDGGVPEDRARTMISGLNLIIIPFSPVDAWATGLLRRRTRHEKLSLGDRACLALALDWRLPAVTTDRAWGRLGLGKAVLVVG